MCYMMPVNDDINSFHCNFFVFIDENNSNSLQCTFHPVAGNLVVTDGTCVGLRKDLNGIYLLKTALQTPVENARDGEIVIELTLPDVRTYLLSLY